MKNLLTTIVISSILLSTNVFAISNEELASKCSDIGKAKIATQADALGCKVDLNQIEVESINNGGHEATIWYQVKGECQGNDSIMRVVGYEDGICY